MAVRVRRVTVLLLAGVLLSGLVVASWEVESANPARTANVSGSVDTTLASAQVVHANISGLAGEVVSGGDHIFVATESGITKLNASSISRPTGDGEATSVSFLNESETGSFLEGSSGSVWIKAESSTEAGFELRLHDETGAIIDRDSMEEAGGRRYRGSVDIPMNDERSLFVSVSSAVDEFASVDIPMQLVNDGPQMALAGGSLFVVGDGIRRLSTDDLQVEGSTDETGFEFITAEGSTIYAYNGDDNRFYQYDAGDLGSPVATSQALSTMHPAVADGTFYAANSSGWLFALDASDISTVQDKSYTDADLLEHPMVTDDGLYVADQSGERLLRRSVSDLGSVGEAGFAGTLGRLASDGDEVFVAVDSDVTKLSSANIQGGGDTIGLPGSPGAIISDGNRVYGAAGGSIYSMVIDSWGGYNQRDVGAVDGSSEGFVNPIVTAGTLVAPTEGDTVVQLSPPPQETGWRLENDLLPAYTYDDQVVVMTRLLNGDGAPVTPGDCGEVFVRYRYPGTSATQMEYVEGSNGYYTAVLDREPGEDVIAFEGEGTDCAFSDGSAVTSVSMSSYSTPGYGTPISVQPRLEGSSSIGAAGDGCKDEGTMTCEKGGNVSVQFSASSNTADSVEVTLQGGGEDITSASLTMADGSWDGEIRIPQELDTEKYGEEINITVEAENDVMSIEEYHTVMVTPIAARIGFSARKQAQGKRVQVQVYPETPYTGVPIDLGEIGLLELSITAPDNTTVVNESKDQLGPLRRPGHNSLVYNYSIPMDATPGTYTVDALIEDVYGANDSVVGSFEVLDVEEVCPTVTDDFCILTEQIEEQFNATGDAFLYVTVQNLQDGQLNVSVSGRGGLQSIVDPRSYVVGQSAEDLAVPLRLSRKNNGRVTGEVAVAVGGSAKLVPASVDVSIPADSISMSIDENDFGTIMSGEEKTVTVTITNTGETAIDDLSLSSSTFLVDKDLSSALPLEAGDSTTQTINIDTAEVVSGEKEGDIVAETSEGGSARVTVSMTIVENRESSIDDLDADVSSIEQSIQRLKAQGANETGDLESSLSSLQSTVSSARTAWEDERYQEAEDLIKDAEEAVTELETDVSRKRQSLEQEEEETTDPGPTEPQSDSSGGMGVLGWMVILLVVGLIGGVLYLSIVPEDQDRGPRGRRQPR